MGEINVQYDAISICTNWQHLSIRDRIRSLLKLQFSCLNIILIAKTYLILYKMTFKSNYTLYLSRYCLMLAFYIFRRDLSLDVLDFKEQCKAHQWHFLHPFLFLQWSFGIVLWELMTRGVTPYPDVETDNLKKHLTGGHRLKKPRQCPEAMYVFSVVMLSFLLGSSCFI